MIMCFTTDLPLLPFLFLLPLHLLLFLFFLSSEPFLLSCLHLSLKNKKGEVCVITYTYTYFHPSREASLTSFSSSFCLLCSSISLLRSARWRARSSMAERNVRKEGEKQSWGVTETSVKGENIGSLWSSAVCSSDLMVLWYKFVCVACICIQGGIPCHTNQNLTFISSVSSRIATRFRN